MVRKTKLGCTILEGNDIADLPVVSENSEILENEILKNSKERHNHTNKNVLANLSEDTEGSLQYKGEDVGKGDMQKSVYDTDGDGKVNIANNSEKLGGQLPDHYARKKDVTDINNKLDTELKKKVDKVTGKQLSTNDYTDAEKQKLSGIEVGAEKNKVTSVNNKTRAVKITKSDVELGNVDNVKQATKTEFNEHTGDTIKHITNTERNIWNTVKNKANSSDVEAELNNKVDKIKNKQLSTEDYTVAEKQKLAGIQAGANKYIHPATHSADIITENKNKRFVSDVEKAKWNSVVDNNFATKSDLQGIITMWSGNITDLPNGWALCDGSNGTPDLQDKFILGASNNAEIGNTGGSHNKSISISNLPAHSHSFETNSKGAHNHNGRYKSFSMTENKKGWKVLRKVSSDDSYDGIGNIVHSSGGAHTHSGTTDSAGQGTEIDIRPAYYKLAFIMYKG